MKTFIGWVGKKVKFIIWHYSLLSKKEALPDIFEMQHNSSEDAKIPVPARPSASQEPSPKRNFVKCRLLDRFVNFSNEYSYLYENVMLFYANNGAQTIRPKTIQPIWNSARNIKTIQPETIQPVLQNARFGRKKLELELFLGLRSPVGALRSRRGDNRL